VEWVKLVVSKVLIGRIPFLGGQIFRFLKFSWSFAHWLGSTPNVNLIVRLFIGVSSLRVGYHDFSTVIYWRVRFFICPPRFLRRGQDESHGTFQRYYLFYLSLVYRRFLFY